MPLKGINWTRLKDHFRKFSPLYLAGIVICVFLTNLIYTMTRPQTPMEQEVMIYLVDDYANIEPLNALEADALAYGQSIDETLVSMHFESIMYTDPAEDYNSAILLMARMSVGDGDVYLANDIAITTLMGTGMCVPLDDYLAAGWMEGLDLEPVSFTNEETGETYIAALRLDNVTALRELGVMANEDAFLVMASNGTNLETSMATTEYIIRTLMEGYDAPAEASES